MSLAEDHTLRGPRATVISLDCATRWTCFHPQFCHSVIGDLSGHLISLYHHFVICQMDVTVISTLPGLNSVSTKFKSAWKLRLYLDIGSLQGFCQLSSNKVILDSGGPKSSDGCP